MTYTTHLTKGGIKTIIEASFYFFFFNDTATTEIYTLSLHDALPILWRRSGAPLARAGIGAGPAHAASPYRIPRRRRKGPPEDPLEDGDLDAVLVLRRPDLRGAGPRCGGDRSLFHRHGVHDRRERVSRASGKRAR